MDRDDAGGSTPARGQALRLAEHERLRALRAERLARLRHDGPSARAEAETALRDFLQALLPEEAAAPAGSRTPPAAAVLPFQRPAVAEPGAAPGVACDLDRLPGAGPGLVGALRRAGLARLADVAALDAADLATRLGPIGWLVPADDWIATARRAAAR